MNNMEQQNGEMLIKLANYRMPFGKYKDRLLEEIPDVYYIWFEKKGFPKGELGKLMAMMLEIKINGLEYLLKPLKGKKNNIQNHNQCPPGCS